MGDGDREGKTKERQGWRGVGKVHSGLGTGTKKGYQGLDDGDGEDIRNLRAKCKGILWEGTGKGEVTFDVWEGICEVTSMMRDGDEEGTFGSIRG